MTHWHRMLRHTFRGTTLKTWLGLESEREAFRRYKAIRRREREFFPPAMPRTPGADSAAPTELAIHAQAHRRV